MQVEALELAVADGRGLDPVSGEGQLAGERARARDRERDPGLGGDAFERVAVFEGDPGLDIEVLAVTLRERRSEPDLLGAGLKAFSV